MEKRTRILSLLTSVMLLLSMTFCVAGCSDKKKKEEQIKKQCFGAVEDYLILLQKGKFEKLSKYCDPDDDPFQDEDAFSGNAEVWQTLLSLMTFEIGEVTLDGDTAEVPVTVILPDAKKIEPSGNKTLTFYAAAEALADVKKTVKTEVTIPLDIDEDKEKATISSTEELFEAIKEQYDIIEEAVPTGNALFSDKLGLFMEHFISMDTDYLFHYSNISGLENYQQEYHKLYTAITSFITYETEEVEIVDEYTANLVLHVHCKDMKKAEDAFFTDMEKLAPMIKRFLTAMIHYDFDSINNDQLDLDAIIPGFKAELEAADDINVDIDCTVWLDPNDPENFTIGANFERIMPIFDPWEYWRDLTDEDALDLYRYAYEQLHDDGVITDKEYHACYLAMEDIGFDPSSIGPVLEKYGFVKNTGTGIIYANPDIPGFSIVITDKGGPMEPVTQNMNLLRDITEEVMEGSVVGKPEGGCFDFEIRGLVSDPSVDGTGQRDAYMRSFAVYQYQFQIRIYNCTDELVEMSHQILSELGLE